VIRRIRSAPNGSPRLIIVAAPVKRAVCGRDGEQCAYVGPGGRRCTARAFLEFHHRKPYDVGGEATVENIELRCKPHNQYEADLFFAASRQRDDHVSWAGPRLILDGVIRRGEPRPTGMKQAQNPG
jgi:hypothetical protein